MQGEFLKNLLIKILIAHVIGVVLALSAATLLLAQDTPVGPAGTQVATEETPAAAANTDALRNAAQNPVASLISVPLQENFNFGIGPADAGCSFPLGKHVEFNTYYEHDNNTGKTPNKQVNSAGLVLYLFFSVPKQ